MVKIVKIPFLRITEYSKFKTIVSKRLIKVAIDSECSGSCTILVQFSYNPKIELSKCILLSNMMRVNVTCGMIE